MTVEASTQSMMDKTCHQQMTLDAVYQATVDEVFSRGRNGPKTNLEGFRHLLSLLGNPEHFAEGRAIHVAGTNGKGSVATKIARSLRHMKLVTGLFLSPHISTPRERIRLAGEMIDKRGFVRLANQVIEVADRNDVSVSFFDILTAIMFLQFSETKPDVIIIETGMGGRLDPTNVLARPVCTVITSVGWDHMRNLGGTLSLIAAEKAGILRPGVPVVFGPEAAEFRDVSIAKCRELTGITEAPEPIVLVPRVPLETIDLENTRIATAVLEIVRTSAFLQALQSERSISLPLTSSAEVAAAGTTSKLVLRNQQLEPEELQSAMFRVDIFMSLLSGIYQLYEDTPLDEVMAWSSMWNTDFHQLIDRNRALTVQLSEQLNALAEELATLACDKLKIQRLAHDLLRRLLIIQGADSTPDMAHQVVDALIKSEGGSIAGTDTVCFVDELPKRSAYITDAVNLYITGLQNVVAWTNQSKNGRYSTPIYPTPFAVILDAAHNRTAIARIIESTRRRWPDKKIRFLFNVSNGRNPIEALIVLDELFDLSKGDEDRFISGVHFLEGQSKQLLSSQEYMNFLQEQRHDTAAECRLKNFLKTQWQEKQCVQRVFSHTNCDVSFKNVAEIPELVKEIAETVKPSLMDALSNDANSELLRLMLLEEELSYALSLSALHSEVVIITGSFYIMEEVQRFLSVNQMLTDVDSRQAQPDSRAGAMIPVNQKPNSADLVLTSSRALACFLWSMYSSRSQSIEDQTGLSRDAIPAEQFDDGTYTPLLYRI